MILSAACGPPPAELVVANGPDVLTLDPHQATSAPEARVLGALTCGLTRLDPATLRPRPELAREWTVTDGGRSWTFVLRPGLTWSDGSPLTADDFVASWLRLLDPRTGAPYANWLAPVLGADAWRPRRAAGADPAPPAGLAADGARLTVRFDRPVPYFAEMCAWHVLAPVHASVRAAPPGSALEGAPTCGPFRLSFRRIRDRVRLERNPAYWDADAVRLATLDFLTVESQFTALNLFLVGDAHYLADVPPLAVPALLQREAERRRQGRPAEFAPSPYLATYFYRFNTTRAPFRDPRVRAALSLAVDREEIVRALGAGHRAADSFTPPWLPGYEPPAGPACNPERARALLAEAGYPGGVGFRRIELLFNTGEVHRDVAEILQDQWRRELGIEVALANQEWKIVLQQQKALHYDLSRSSWIADYLDPESFLEVFRGDGENNRTGWRNAAYDGFLEEARAGSVASERREAFRAAEALLLESAPILPLFYYQNLDLVSERLRGFHRNPRGYVDWGRLSIGDAPLPAPQGDG